MEPNNITSFKDDPTISHADNSAVIARQLSGIADPVERQKYLDKFLSQKRKARTRNNMPYYKFKYGIQMMQAVEEMIKQRQKRYVWYLKDFPGMTSLRTLYQRVMQSKLFVTDNLDPEGKYALYLEGIDFSTATTSGAAVVATVNYDIINEELGAFNPTSIADSASRWKEDLEDYLENAKPGDPPFHRTGLIISYEDQERYRSSLDDLGNAIIFKITDREIKIVKI